MQVERKIPSKNMDIFRTHLAMFEYRPLSLANVFTRSHCMNLVLLMEVCAIQRISGQRMLLEFLPHAQGVQLKAMPCRAH